MTTHKSQGGNVEQKFRFKRPEVTWKNPNPLQSGIGFCVIGLTLLLVVMGCVIAFAKTMKDVQSSQAAASQQVLKP